MNYPKRHSYLFDHECILPGVAILMHNIYMHIAWGEVYKLLVLVMTLPLNRKYNKNHFIAEEQFTICKIMETNYVFSAFKILQLYKLSYWISLKFSLQS